MSVKPLFEGRTETVWYDLIIPSYAFNRSEGTTIYIYQMTEQIYVLQECIETIAENGDIADSILLSEMELFNFNGAIALQSAISLLVKNENNIVQFKAA